MKTCYTDYYFVEIWSLCRDRESLHVVWRFRSTGSGTHPVRYHCSVHRNSQQYSNCNHFLTDSCWVSKWFFIVYISQQKRTSVCVVKQEKFPEVNLNSNSTIFQAQIAGKQICSSRQLYAYEGLLVSPHVSCLFQNQN